MTIPDWNMLIHPLELYGVLTITGCCLLYVFVVHVKMRALARTGRDQQESLENRLAQVTEALERIQSQEPRAERPSPAPGQALNLNKRGQVLRMRRRGEKPETIAGALGIPRNEVDLLLKVHQMAIEHVEKSAETLPA